MGRLCCEAVLILQTIGNLLLFIKRLQSVEGGKRPPRVFVLSRGECQRKIRHAQSKAEVCTLVTVGKSRATEPDWGRDDVMSVLSRAHVSVEAKAASGEA